MKKDLLLLAAIAGVIAIAFAVAVARAALPVPRVVNPLANWPNWKVAAALAFVVTATVLSALAILRSDRGLPWPSATLEWVYSSDRAQEIVDDYGDLRLRAVRGVVIDSVAFIPSYVLLIAISSFWIARGSTSGHWAAWTIAVGWAAAFAGALDYLENAGILAALGGVTTRLAPFTYAACQLKWLIGFAAADFAIIALIVMIVQRASR